MYAVSWASMHPLPEVSAQVLDFGYIIGECLLPGKQPGYAYPYSHTWKVPKQYLHDKEPTLSMTCLMNAAHVLSAHVHINLA